LVNASTIEAIGITMRQVGYASKESASGAAAGQVAALVGKAGSGS
jgi:hypothetical protein